MDYSEKRSLHTDDLMEKRASRMDDFAERRASRGDDILDDPLLSREPVGPAPGLLPLHAHLLAICAGGGGEVRRPQGGLAGGSANPALPSVSRGRL